MAAYLRAWWFGTSVPSEEPESTPAESPSNPAGPSVPILAASAAHGPAVAAPPAVSISTPADTEGVVEGDEEGALDDMDDDIPPAFPSLDSIQRSSAARAKADARLMPPPTFPASLRPPSATAIPSILRLPTTSSSQPPFVPGASSNTLRLPPSTTHIPSKPSKKREKVALAPGHSLLDWGALKTSGQDLRGTPGLMRVTPSELKRHNRRDDAWSAYHGKVYNITPFLPYHPGGEKELLRAAGRDGTKLFALTHAWVNVDFMLDECMVGFLVPEPSSGT